MTMDAFRLDGKLALVTGGGTGLGFGICQALTEAGARLVITGRREAVLREACRALGDGASHLRHDGGDLPAIPALVQAVEDRSGPLDILANNAGNHLKAPALDTSDADLASILQTHLPGAFALSRKAFEGDPDRKRRILERTPLRRLGEVIDVGYAAVCLSSAAGRFVTGAVLPIDGGVSIGF